MFTPAFTIGAGVMVIDDLIAHRIAVAIAHRGECQGHGASCAFRSARCVDRVERAVVRVVGACTTGPDTAGRDGDRAVQLHSRVVRTDRLVRTSVRRRRSTEGDRHLIRRRRAARIAGGDQGQRHATRRDLCWGWRVHRVHRGVVRVVGARTTGPLCTGADGEAARERCVRVVAAYRLVRTRIRDRRLRVGDRHRIVHRSAGAVTGGGCDQALPIRSRLRSAKASR